ncbi:MAG: hypothetical protein HFH41_12460 [Lachnospiraceae bacterium]|nr:hypothetical protein [Lachnospiraceae bacterium]
MDVSRKKKNDTIIKNKTIVEGFSFTEKEIAKKALREAESIRYVKENLDMENPRMVLEMYRKLTAEKVFETPVGMMYLKRLQDYLLRIPEIQREGLEPIQVSQMVRESSEKNRSGQTKNQGTGNPASQEPAVTPQQNGQQNMEPSDLDEMAVWYEEQLDQEKQKRRGAELKQRQTEGRLKTNRGFLRFSIAGNLFLLILVIGMVVITLLDDHPNIINYEDKIVNQYEEWERELEEREKKIEKLEREQNP